MPTRRPLRSRMFAMAVALAGLAGWVDATAFVRFARTYVSFMSGNSTALAAAVSGTDSPRLVLLASVLLAFVAGVIAGESIAIAAGRRRHAAALVGEAAVLATAGVTALPAGAPFVPTVLLAFALGIQNAALHSAGGLKVALTYVTGTLVRLGRAITAALVRRGKWRAALPHAFLWLGLMAGAVAGAAVARVSAALSIFLAAMIALAIAAVTGAAAPRG